MYKRINYMHILVIGIASLGFAFTSQYLLSKTPLSAVKIELKNGDVFPSADENVYEWDAWNAPYAWTKDVAVVKGYNPDMGGYGDAARSGYLNLDNLPTGKSIILRAAESDRYSFDNFKEYILSNVCDMAFPTFYERLGLNQSYSRNISFEHSDIEFLKYTKSIFKNAITRKALFECGLLVFDQLKYNFPTTWKKHYLNVISNCISFLSNYKVNKSKYLSVELNESKSQKYLVEYIGIYNSFLYRRIEHDLVPIEELHTYLLEVKKAIEQSINTNSPSNIKTVDINNGSIFISDEEISGSGLDVRVWNSKTKRSLVFKKYSKVKCLVEDKTNFYLIYHGNQTSLINENLDIIYSATN